MLCKILEIRKCGEHVCSEWWKDNDTERTFQVRIGNMLGSTLSRLDFVL